jgi:hypothetical protein
MAAKEEEAWAGLISIVGRWPIQIQENRKLLIANNLRCLKKSSLRRTRDFAGRLWGQILSHMDGARNGVRIRMSPGHERLVNGAR